MLSGIISVALLSVTIAGARVSKVTDLERPRNVNQHVVEVLLTYLIGISALCAARYL